MINRAVQKVKYKIEWFLIRRKFRNRILPIELQRPFHYLFDEKIINDSENEQVKKVELLRQNLASRKNDKINILYSPKPKSSGTTSSEEMRPQPGEEVGFDLARIANHTSISQYWGSFLYLLALGTRSKRILELGSCAGISGSYLASSNFCEEFITIEASNSLAEIANSNIGSVRKSAFKVYNMLFDDALDIILPKEELGFDMVWIDGHHEKIATIHYFQRLIPYLNKNAIVLFDDITWSSDMYEAWEILSGWNGFSMTFNLMNEKGMCIWHGQNTTPKKYNIAHPHRKKKITVPTGWIETKAE